MNPIAVALSGLAAATARLATSAANIANAQTTAHQPNPAVPLPADTFLALPHFDLATEMIAQMTALHAYRANLETIRTADALQSELLRIV